MKFPFSNNRLFIFIHTLVIYVWTICATAVMGLLAILVSLFAKTGNSVQHVARAWARSILWGSGIHVTISGLDQIDPNSSYIYMANHQSQFDIPVLLSSLPVQCRWLAKAELFKIPIFGRGMRGAGYISIDRSNRKAAFHSLDQAAKSIRSGSSVVIFPEGTRSPDGRLLPFKKGGFVLAVDAGAPIIPVMIYGTLEIMPKGNWLIRSRSVHVELLPAIDCSPYSRKTKDSLLENIRSVMTDALDPDLSGDHHA